MYESIGFATNLEGLGDLIDWLLGMSIEEFLAVEDNIVLLWESHFLVPGVMGHIGRFMNQLSSDLQCQPLPSTARDEEL